MRLWQDCGRIVPNPTGKADPYSITYYTTAFQKLKAAGANTARFWLFGGGCPPLLGSAASVVVHAPALPASQRTFRRCCSDGRAEPFFQSNLAANDTAALDPMLRNTVIKYPGGQNGNDPKSENAFDDQV